MGVCQKVRQQAQGPDGCNESANFVEEHPPAVSRGLLFVNHLKHGTLLFLEQDGAAVEGKQQASEKFMSEPGQRPQPISRW
jgi:hypothetical protein